MTIIRTLFYIDYYYILYAKSVAQLSVRNQNLHYDRLDFVSDICTRLSKVIEKLTSDYEI